MQIPKKIDTIKDTVYKELFGMISTGQLSTDVVFTEAQMIKRFSVSKAPVREALVQLCHEGTLVSLPRMGYQVLEISPKNICDSTKLRMLLELGSLPDVLQNIDVAKMEEIRNLNAERKTLTKTCKTAWWDLWENNLRFHMKLNSFADNTQVYETLERTLSMCTRAYAQLFTSQGAVMYPEGASPSRHDFIVEALEAHDLFSTHELLRNDIIYLQHRLLSNGDTESNGVVI